MCGVELRERTVSVHRHVAARGALPGVARRRGRRWIVLAAVLAGIAMVAAGFFLRGWWLPLAPGGLNPHGAEADACPADHACDGSCTQSHADHAIGVLLPGFDDAAPLPQHDAHAPASEAHAEHDEANTLHLSPEARKNVGLKLLTVEPRDFDRTITVPAMVIERPGRTRIKVSAPMTGIVTRVYPIRGEAVAPGQPLFDLRLTHEDLVAVQSEYLRTVEELEVIRREVVRLEKVTASGAIAGKTLLARQYELQKTEAQLHAQQQALILHGLSESQVAAIAAERRLLQEVSVVVPEQSERPDDAETPLLEVAAIEVEQGQHVAAGEPLCALTDHAELYIEGKAFAEDAEKLDDAARLGSPITALIRDGDKRTQSIDGLRILYVENEVERQSRALRFYVRLPNEPVRNETLPDGHRFVAWRYKPGQRIELLVPVERWENRIVLPVDAVVADGADYYVFVDEGGCFERRPVHVEYRDPRHAVLGADTTLSAGDSVVASGAYQMHLALKNRSGGGEQEGKHVGCSH